jgi:hypothetical protein
MVFIVADRVKESSVTQGSGNITFSGAAGGFQTFLAAIGSGNSTFYAVENGTQWEVGVGTYGQGGNYLERSTVLKSSNSNELVSLTGVSIVFCTYPASQAAHFDLDGWLSTSGHSGIKFPDGTMQTTAIVATPPTPSGDISNIAKSGVLIDSVFVDGSTIDFTVVSGVSVSGSIVANSIQPTHLATGVAGIGLTGGNGSAFSIDLSEFSAVTPASGDSFAVLDSDGTTEQRATISAVGSYLAGNGLSAGGGGVLAVNVDSSTVEINSDTLRVKDGGITETKLVRTVDTSFSNNETITSDINLVVAGVSDIAIKLPAPTSGKIVYIQKTDGGDGRVLIIPNGLEYVNGAGGIALYFQYDSALLVSNGSNWFSFI